MLRDFKHQTIALIGRLQCIEDRRQIAVELHVDNGADDWVIFPTAFAIVVLFTKLNYSANAS